MIQQNKDVYRKSSKTRQRRFQKSISFVEKHLDEGSHILDLGIDNKLAQQIRNRGYKVDNTDFGVDLDDDYRVVEGAYDCVTSFEIFEHMVSPYPLLKSIAAPRLITSVPLRLWFATAYWNETEEWDRHYHEFEPRQFDMLLNKAGWSIKDSVKWKAYDNSIGFRPLLRRLVDRYYLVYCERS